MVLDESAILDILEAAARIHRFIKGSARLRIVRLGNRTYVKREAPHALTLSALASRREAARWGCAAAPRQLDRNCLEMLHLNVV